MTTPSPFSRLAEYFDGFTGLASADEHVDVWDQIHGLPSASDGRGRARAAIAAAQHRLLVHDDLGRLLEALSASGMTGPEQRAYDLVLRERQRAMGVPVDVVTRLAAAKAAAKAAWEVAKPANRFGVLAGPLQAVIDISAEKGAALQHALGFADPYDGLIDGFETGMTGALADELFDDLGGFSAQLLADIRAAGVDVDMSPFIGGHYSVADQDMVTRWMICQMGADFTRATLHRSSHPFMGPLASPGEIVMTTWYDEGDFRKCLFARIHEGGHGMYEQGLDPALFGTPLEGAVSSGVHEAMSRLWENLVARDRSFWVYWLPILRRVFPSFKDVTVDQAFRAANAVVAQEDNVNRVSADQLTYNLHIILRYRIERRLLSGELRAADLPDAWAAECQSLLGVTPKTDKEGVLQDIHWPSGLFGYFPTYSIGNIFGAQLMVAAREALPELDTELARGNYDSLRAWLTEKVFRKGRTLSVEQLIKAATGSAPTAEHLKQHLRRTLGPIYGLTA